MTIGSERSLEWYCIQTPPSFCDDCDGYFRFVHFESKIVVWPSRDDPMLLDTAVKLQKRGGEGKIVQYDRSFGNYVNFYEVYP